MEKIICKAAVTDGKGNFSIAQVEVVEPSFDEILVKIKSAGICPTDHDSLKWGKPFIPGHESARTIAAPGRKFILKKRNQKDILLLFNNFIEYSIHLSLSRKCIALIPVIFKH